MMDRESQCDSMGVEDAPDLYTGFAPTSSAEQDEMGYLRTDKPVGSGSPKPRPDRMKAGDPR